MDILYFIFEKVENFYHDLLKEAHQLTIALKNL
jgi:hypothetical protein